MRPWDAPFLETIDLYAAKSGEELVKEQSFVFPDRGGDLITLRQGQVERVLHVRALSSIRGPAPVAQALYEETPDSVSARQKAAEARRMGVEPALALNEGRPTKRDRRDIGRAWHDGLDADRHRPDDRTRRRLADRGAA